MPACLLTALVLAIGAMPLKADEAPGTTGDGRVWATTPEIITAQAEFGGPARRPNVVLVLTDDQGYGDLGVHGNPVLRTPNLDAFSREAIGFSNFHVSPTCSPTRAALLTGRDSNRTGVWHTAAGRGLMRRDEVTLAQMMREAGYATGISASGTSGPCIRSVPRTGASRKYSPWWAVGHRQHQRLLEQHEFRPGREPQRAACPDQWLRYRYAVR